MSIKCGKETENNSMSIEDELRKMSNECGNERQRFKFTKQRDINNSTTTFQKQAVNDFDGHIFRKRRFQTFRFQQHQLRHSDLLIDITDRLRDCLASLMAILVEGV